MPKPLPWPFTLGHEIGGVIVEKGPELKADFMGKPLEVGSKIMIPPLMPCGSCDYCLHYPQTANKCLTPVYYGRYLGFDKAPHLWGGWAEYVYVDLDMLPGTKIYKLPDDMSLRLGSLSEPLTSAIRSINRAKNAGGFSWGDTVVIQGSGPIGILAVAAAQEMGAGRVICVGAPETPRLELAGNSVPRPPWISRSTRLPMNASAACATLSRVWRRSRGGLLGPSHRRAGGHRVPARWRHLCRDGPVHRCWRHHDQLAPDLHQGPERPRLWAFTANDLPLGVDMLYKTRNKYPWLDMQTIYPFTEDGVSRAVADAMAMRTVKSTIIPWPELVE